MRPDILDAGPVLLYDGTCGFCAESVQLVLRHDRRKTLRFASLQGELGRAIRIAHPELDAVDSMVWVDRDPAGGTSRVLVRSDAGLRIAGYLGGWWRLAIIGRLVPRVARDGIYGLIARHRHRLVGSGPTCLVPAPDVRERFLDRAEVP